MSIQQQNLVFKQALDSGAITQSQYDAAMLQQENIVFNQALESGQITQEQYDQAMQKQEQQARQQNLIELTTVAAQPTSNEAALAQGSQTYIPQEKKDQFYNQMANVYDAEMQAAEIAQQNQAAQQPEPAQAQAPPASSYPSLFDMSGKPGVPAPVKNESTLTLPVGDYKDIFSFGIPEGTVKVTTKPPEPTVKQLVPDNQEAMLGFGLQASLYDPKTGKMYVQQGTDTAAAIASVTAKNSNIPDKFFAEVVPDTKDIFGKAPAKDVFEERLAQGTLLFPAMAMPFVGPTVKILGANIPKTALFAAGGVGAGEAYTRVTEGRDITVPEAIGWMAMGEIAGITSSAVASRINAKYVQPRVTAKLTESYMNQQKSNIDVLTGKTEGQPQIWKPSTAQDIQMKITGAKPKGLASGLSGFQSAQDTPVNMRMLQGSSDAFDFGVAPKSSYVGINKGLTPERIATTPSTAKLPLYFGLGDSLISAKSLKDPEPLSFKKTGAETSDPYGPVPESIKRTIEKGGMGSKLSFEKPKIYNPSNIPEEKLISLEANSQLDFSLGNRNTAFKKATDIGLKAANAAEQQYGISKPNVKETYPQQFKEPATKTVAKTSLDLIPKNTVKAEVALSPKQFGSGLTSPATSTSRKRIDDALGILNDETNSVMKRIDNALIALKELQADIPKLDAAKSILPTSTYKTNLKHPPSILSTQPAMPGTKQRILEEQETIYLTTPNSGLPHPAQPQFITDITQKNNPMHTQAQSDFGKFTGDLNIGLSTVLIPKTREPQVTTPYNRVRQVQNPITSLTPLLTQRTTQTQTPIFQPITPQKTTPLTETPLFPRNTTPFSPFMFPGSKTMEFGGNAYSNPNFIGSLSIKRKYPIKTPEEFWM